MTAKTSGTSEDDIFRKYVATRKILIADGSSSARSGVFGVFSQLGVKPFQVTLASSMEDAEAEIKLRQPDIVIAEFDFGRGCGLDLLQRQRESNPDSKKSIFILLTTNCSQSAIARAAEEDCDAFILKPFTPEVFRKTVIRAAVLKSHPPKYVEKIESGKAKLAAKDFDGADRDFQEAKSLDPSPSLAWYYLGQSAFLRKVLQAAEGSYKSGLEFNKIHYKCLVGLYELFREMDQPKEAYEVVKRISQYFPANPKRLAEVLRLAIQTKSYGDIEKYYAAFCNIDERNQLLVEYVCAALIVTGRYYLRSNSRARALELFQKALATSAGRAKFIREIIQSLIDSRLASEAKNFLERYPPEDRGSIAFLLLHFQIINLTSNATQVLSYGRDLMAKGADSERFYEIMLARALEAKNKRMCENLLSLCVKYPTIHEKFSQEYKALTGGEQARGRPEKE